MPNDGTIKIGTEIDKNGLTSDMNSMGSLVKKGLGGVAKLAKISAAGIAAVSTAMGAGVVAGVKYNATMQDFMSDFTVMLGDAEKATKFVDDMKSMAAATPFEMTDLAQASKTLLAFNSTSEEAIGQIKMLGDISLGNSQKLGTLSTAFGRIQSNGKATMEEINMMIDSGFNPLNIIAQQTGETMQEVRDRVSKGAVSFDEISHAMVIATSEGGQFYKGMETASKTFNGQISTLKDNANALIGQVVQPISEKMTNVLLPSAIETIDKITKEYEENGLDGLVRASGDAFADIVAGAASQAPKLVDVAVDFIESFIDGVKRNKKKLISAAGEIVKSIAGGLADLLPKSVQKPVKDAIASVEKSLTSGGIKKAVQTFLRMFENIADSAGNLAGKIIPPVIKIIDLLADHMDILIPVAATLLTTIKGFSAASKVSKDVGSLVGTVKNLFGLISSNPLGAFISVVAGVTAGIAALYTVMDDTYGGTERLEKAYDNLGEAYGRIGEKTAEFNDGIREAKSIFDGMNESVIVSSEKQQELSDTMDEVQQEITQIAKTASDERRQLTQDEITRLDDLFAKMQEVTRKELEIYSAKQQAVKDAAVALVNSRVSEASNYEQQAQRIIKSAQDERDTVIDTAYQQMIEKNAINQQLLGTAEEYNAAWLERQQQAAQKEYEAAVDAASTKAADTLAIVTKGYEDQFLVQNNALIKFGEINEASISEENRYRSEMDAAQKEYNDLLKGNWDDNKDAIRDATEKIEEIEDRHKNNLAAIYEGITDSMNDQDANQIAAWLSMLANTELYGGKISDEASKQVDIMLDIYDKMPEETRSAMKNAMAPMLEEMKNSEPTLYSKAEGIAGGVLSRLKKAFDIHSPSRKTRKIFKQVMQGAELGWEENKKSLYDKVAETADDVTGRISGIDARGIMERVMASISDRHARVSTSVSAQNEYRSGRGNGAETESQTGNIDYEKMAAANARAMEGMAVELEEREVGRVIRKVVPV